MFKMETTMTEEIEKEQNGGLIYEYSNQVLLENEITQGETVRAAGRLNK